MGCEFALPFVFTPYFADSYGGKGCQLLIHRDCREMLKIVFDFPNELIDKVIEIS